jgi:transglutaminase-like putative cysteine protease
MRLKITHRTEYRFGQLAAYALQRLRLVPISGATQTVRSWTLTIEGAREEVRFSDHFGNDTRLISMEGEPHSVTIEAAGEVETVNKAGVTGMHRGFAPLWLFLRETPLTVPGEAAEALAAAVPPGADVARLHELMAAVHDRFAGAAEKAPQPQLMQAQGGAMQVQADATEATAGGISACVDHTHMFMSAARLLGFPARFVSGYRMADGGGEQAASHCWAEAHVGGLGWVGFDIADCISPEEHYVRVAIGCDHRDAMPVSGIPPEQSEGVAVRITVEQ